MGRVLGFFQVGPKSSREPGRRKIDIGRKWQQNSRGHRDSRWCSADFEHGGQGITKGIGVFWQLEKAWIPSLPGKLKEEPFMKRS